MNKKEIKKLYKELKLQYKLDELPIGNENLFVKVKGETADAILFAVDHNDDGHLYREQGIFIYNERRKEFIDQIIELIEA